MIPGTPHEEILLLCGRLKKEGLCPVPHIAARTLNRQSLEELLSGFRDLGVCNALLLAGDTPVPAGEFSSAMDVLRWGQIKNYGFRQIDVVAHPEGSSWMKDPVHFLMQKLDWAKTEGVEMDIVTQVCFDMSKTVTLVQQLRSLGIQNTVRVGLPGPTKLDTLIKYAEVCGVGPSIQYLKEHASIYVVEKLTHHRVFL